MAAMPDEESRMKLRYRTSRQHQGIDLTPLMDVMFIILIFFMVAATFELNRTIKLSLPKSLSGESKISKDKLIIEVGADGEISLNGEIIRLSQLSEQIQQTDNYGECTVYILGDENADYRYIVEVIDVLKVLSVSDISLVTDDKEGF